MIAATSDDPSAPTIEATGLVRADVDGVTSIGAAAVGTGLGAEAALPSTGGAKSPGDDAGDDPAGAGGPTGGAAPGDAGVGAGAEDDADGA